MKSVLCFSIHYTISQLAQFLNIKPNQFFELLVDCSYVACHDDRYEIWDAGAALGGIYCRLPNDEFNMMFPGSILDDQGIKDGLAELRNKQKFSSLLRNAK